MHKMLAGDREPWMTVLLDGDLETSLTRARARNSIAGSKDQGSKDEGRFEAESIAFYERVESGFREVAARETHRVVMVDARRSVSSIHEEIVANLDRRLTRDVVGDVYQAETPPESRSVAGTGMPS